MLGATLIELVIAIVVIGSASVTLIGMLSSMSKQSADAMVSTQASGIAAAYLKEILSKPVVDPDGADGAESRDAYDNIDDYSRLPDTSVRDLRGNLVPNLGGYQVAVLIQQVPLNGGGGSNLVPAAQSRRVQVTVTGPTGFQVQLRGYRTRHE